MQTTKTQSWKRENKKKGNPLIKNTPCVNESSNPLDLRDSADATICPVWWESWVSNCNASSHQKNCWQSFCSSRALRCHSLWTWRRDLQIWNRRDEMRKRVRKLPWCRRHRRLCLLLCRDEMRSLRMFDWFSKRRRFRKRSCIGRFSWGSRQAECYRILWKMGK